MTLVLGPVTMTLARGSVTMTFVWPAGCPRRQPGVAPGQAPPGTMILTPSAVDDDGPRPSAASRASDAVTTLMPVFRFRAMGASSPDESLLPPDPRPSRWSSELRSGNLHVRSPRLRLRLAPSLRSGDLQVRSP